MQFDWINFYSEFATKLLEFKNNRAELIADIQSAYSAINMKLPKLESEDSIIDIDPFTVFGLFNKGITNANRTAILESFATVFNIKSKVPDNFDGIPVLNNLRQPTMDLKMIGRLLILITCGGFMNQQLILRKKMMRQTVRYLLNGMIQFMIS